MSTIPLRQAKEVRSGGQKLLDVRTPVEFVEMHIADSQSLPLDELARRAGELDPSLQYLLICHSGKRAAQAAELLSARGFSRLEILDGGVLAWQQSGLPLIRSGKKRLPLMRQVQLIIGLLSLTSSILALTVNVKFAIVPAFLGAGLTLAGSTGWCGLAILLSKMPWNRVQADGCCASGDEK